MPKNYSYIYFEETPLITLIPCNDDQAIHWAFSIIQDLMFN